MMDQVTSSASEIAAANFTHSGKPFCHASPSALSWLDTELVIRDVDMMVVFSG